MKRRPFVDLARLGLIAGLSLGALRLAAQEAPPAAPVSQPEKTSRPGVYVGTGSCANGLCHGAKAPQAGAEVLQNEFNTWLLDPHRKAYDTLSEAPSAAIAALLEPGRKASEMPLCLDCHTVVAPARLRDGLFLEDGVSCEGCHGPAGGWFDRHYEEGWSHADSVAAGMADLASPAARGAVCLRCHLGDAESTVDHRLIAAGHPQLTFELDNYTDNARLPRHWKLGAERGAGERPTHGVPAWAAGQAAAFRQGLLQLAGRAAGDGPWPEPSELSCRNCHHALGSGWRERPGYRFRGGQPAWSPARWVVLRQLVAEVAPEELPGLDEAVRGLAERVGRTTGREAVAKEARALAEGLAPVASRLERVRWNEATVRRLAGRIAGDREALLAADVASAEQAVLALQTLTADLVGRDPSRVGSRLVTLVDRLFAALDDPERLDWGRFADLLIEVEREVTR